MSGNSILTDLDDHGVLTITFNRPEKKNAFNNPMFIELRDALDEARNNDDVTVLVITGAGNDFTSGVDLNEFGGEDIQPHPTELMFDALCAFDKPLLAAAKGAGIGFGATVLFHCDVVYLGESTRLRLPFANLGLVTEAAASYLMPLMIGPQQAAELLFTAEWIDAQRALETGIARQIFPDNEVLAKTQEKAREMSQWSLSALRGIKQLLQMPRETGVNAARIAEYKMMRELAGTPENIEAITAFMEKRKPDFKKLRNQGS